MKGGNWRIRRPATSFSGLGLTCRKVERFRKWLVGTCRLGCNQPTTGKRKQQQKQRQQTAMIIAFVCLRWVRQSVGKRRKCNGCLLSCSQSVSFFLPLPTESEWRLMRHHIIRRSAQLQVVGDSHQWEETIKSNRALATFAHSATSTRSCCKSNQIGRVISSASPSQFIFFFI